MLRGRKRGKRVELWTIGGALRNMHVSQITVASNLAWAGVGERCFFNQRTQEIVNAFLPLVCTSEQWVLIRTSHRIRNPAEIGLEFRLQMYTSNRLSLAQAEAGQPCKRCVGAELFPASGCALCSLFSSLLLSSSDSASRKAALGEGRWDLIRAPEATCRIASRASSSSAFSACASNSTGPYRQKRGKTGALAKDLSRASSCSNLGISRCFAFRRSECLQLDLGLGHWAL